MKKSVAIIIAAALLIGLFLTFYILNTSGTSADEHSQTDSAESDADHAAEPETIAETVTDDHTASDHAASTSHDIMVMPSADDAAEPEATATEDHTASTSHDAMVMPGAEHTEERATAEAVADDHTSTDHAASDDHASPDHAEADHTATVETDAAHSDDHAETDSGHGHGEPQIGYIGIEDKTDIDEAELARFVEHVKEDAYKKGELDQIRFVIFGLFFVLTYLAFAKIKTGNLSDRLKNAIDWHTLGTVTGIVLIFLVIPSGIIITFFYMPTSTEVYASVEDMTDEPALAFFRNLHNWSSEIFILLSLLHAARTVSTRTFLGKRKLIWLLGALALVVGWIAFLSGTFMRGDQEALEGFEHMMYSFTLVPLGRSIAEFFSGEYTLMKLTALHIGATIFIMAVTLVLHVLMRKVHVLVTTRWKKAVVYSLALTLFLVVQSFLMEAPFIVGPESGPTVSGIEATKPPWPIYFLIQGENWFGADAMVMILAVAFIPLIVFPYAVEFLPLKTAKKARAGEALFYIGIFLMIGISYIAAAGEIKAHIF